jgi:hypothetical protein
LTGSQPAFCFTSSPSESGPGFARLNPNGRPHSTGDLEFN